MPTEDRDAWLIDQCGDDEKLLNEVRSLLQHDNPDDDPLEKGLVEAVGEIPSTLIPNPTGAGDLSESDVLQVDSELFLSKLSEVGVMRPEEIEALNRTDEGVFRTTVLINSAACRKNRVERLTLRN